LHASDILSTVLAEGNGRVEVTLQVILYARIEAGQILQKDNA
jgi:hypothetical protein